MARKKEYSLMDGTAKKRNPSSLTKPANNVGNSFEQSSDCNSCKTKPSKHKDQNLDATSSGSSGGGKLYDVGPLRAQLGSYGLTLRDIPGDGNCLFRALGDQLDGHSTNHLKHRMDTVRYMIAHRHHFEPFIDVPFERYVENLSRPGTYAGQDALVAFARLHKVNIIIHQLNSPLWQIQGCDNDSDNERADELHLFYHNGEHYSSVRRFGDSANTPPHIRIVSQITGTTEVPCCASSHTICTSSSPITSQVSGTTNTSTKSTYISPSTNPIPIPKSTQSSVRNTSYLHNEDEFSMLLEEIMMRSGCRDSVLATEAFIDNGGDMDHTIDYLMSLSVILDPVDETANDCRTERQHKQRCRRISDRCIVDDEGSRERFNAPNRHLSRTRTQHSLRVIPTTERERITPKKKAKATAQKQTTTNHQSNGWERNLEGDLRFLTL